MTLDIQMILLLPVQCSRRSVTVRLPVIDSCLYLRPLFYSQAVTETRKDGTLMLQWNDVIHKKTRHIPSFQVTYDLLKMMLTDTMSMFQLCKRLPTNSTKGNSHCKRHHKK